jgi:hypothetical protein
MATTTPPGAASSAHTAPDAERPAVLTFPAFEPPVTAGELRLAAAEAQRQYEHAKRAHYAASEQVIAQQRECDRIALAVYRAYREAGAAETPAKEAHKRNEEWLAACELLQQIQDDRLRLDLDVSIARERLRTLRAFLSSDAIDPSEAL